MNRIFIVFSFCALVSCESREYRINKFSDQTLVMIADLQDRRLSDSLYQFFNHENPVYRKDAVLAFASIQDTLAIVRLGNVLETDSDSNVRSAAAFALGQTGTAKSFAALMVGLASEKNALVQKEIIEACGKTSTNDTAVKLTLSDKQNQAEGFAWAYYRLALRGQADSSVVEKAAVFLYRGASSRART